MPTQVATDPDIQGIQFECPLALRQRLAELAHGDVVVREPVMRLGVIVVESDGSPEVLLSGLPVPIQLQMYDPLAAMRLGQVVVQSESLIRRFLRQRQSLQPKHQTMPGLPDI